jgi:murein DD-endopeptidase MepM/ murein hydrolase activator NlpD
MKSVLKRITCVTLCLVITICAVNILSFVSFAATKEETQLKNDIASLKAQAAEIQKDIDRLKAQKADQGVILKAAQRKVANTQAQITRCNNEINSINSKIAENKAQIDKNNEKIEDSKLAFKKRLRAIYMSNSSGSTLQILLGAENFAEYLQLAQLTSSVASRDKAMMEDLAAEIKALEEKNKENEKLIESQVEIRASIQSQMDQLKAEEAEVAAIYNGIASEQKDAEKDKADINRQIKDKQDALDSIANGGGQYSGKINPNTGFMWPVPGHYNVTSGWGYRWGSLHKGLDISDGRIYRAPIVAIADGTIYETYNSCGHKSKSPDCRCGSGWGNHIAINHGKMSKIDGAVYKAMYAHMDSIAAGMYVGKEVKQGQIIGYVGTTGWSTGYHLHFGLYRNDIWVNPENYL